MKEELTMALGTLLCVMVSFLISSARNYFQARIEDLKKSEAWQDKEIIQTGLKTAERVIEFTAEAIVAKIEEVTAKELREKIKKGEAPRDALLELADKAYYEILTTVRPEILEMLAEGIHDVEGYIRSQIEKQLLFIKAMTSNDFETESFEQYITPEIKTEI